MSLNKQKDRIIEKGNKYINITKGALLGGSDEWFRLVNIVYDLKECFSQKFLNNIKKNTGIININNKGAEELLFRHIEKEELYNSIVQNFIQDGVYSVNTLASCGDETRKHPHAFIIEKQEELYTIYFLDSEYNIGKRDIFSVMVTNGFKLTRDNNNKSRSIHIIRLTNKQFDQNIHKLRNIYNLLKTNSQEDIMEKYNPYILVNCEYNSGGIFKSTKRDGKLLSEYTKAKINSTSYLLSLIHKLSEAKMFEKEKNPEEKITFTSQADCNLLKNL